MSDDLPIYQFSDSELKALVSFFRKSPPLPNELYSLNVFAEKYIYRNLTISEAEQLYGDR
ncbi:MULTISPECIES: hypothetical protein [unclassified Treponema]|uniref:hypothetical protein n=1 Tax=unclassified Treponema TaxID=2638727 RepID=UPI00053014DC|nr:MULTISPECIES: hypothetical protein [unclassified Treponema]AIW90203.1 hypothetical protein JO41_10665 [Treponema sp. OMZ 838]UTC49753.1 hypothetical protein E4N65_06430 [Treponema sp. OMZ 855]